MNFKLRYMLASTDEEFDVRVKEAVERRRRFESGVVYKEPEDHISVSEIPDNLVHGSEY